MNLLYSNILPLGTEEGQETVSNQLKEEIANSDAIEIAVGYVSKASLEELDRIVTEQQIHHVILTIGMYFVEGMPEAMYHTAVAINQKWVVAGIGEIRMVRAFKYHGKLYAFYRDQQVRSAIVGSANLGVIKQEATNLRQYEVSAVTVEQSECDEIATLIHKLASPACSARIDEITGMTLIREVNVSLTGVDTVDQLPQTQVELFEKHKTDISFILPIKVPAYAERHMDDGKHYTKSNLNVAMLLPEVPENPVTGTKPNYCQQKITLLPGYPEKNVAFYVITDDGYTFKAHTTSDGNKQFSAVGDELILGRWIKAGWPLPVW